MLKRTNLHGHRTSVAAEPFIMRELDSEPHELDCIDGRMTAVDVGRAAGVSRKEAARVMKAYCDAHEDGRNHDGGSTFTFESTGVPHPKNLTRAAMALIVAEKLGIGRFGLQKRIEERKRMSATHHPWNLGKHGRSVRSENGGGLVATLTCSRCPTSLDIRFRQLAESGAMDKKFTQQGWAVDPAKCPDHNRHNHVRKEKPVSTATAPAPTFAAPTPAAIAAQAKMFGLLQVHFDPESGTYSNDYSDAKIASECRLSVDLVAGVRKEAFGELKVPSEVAALQADIAALESLLEETVAPIHNELRTLKNRVAECCRKFGG